MNGLLLITLLNSALYTTYGLKCYQSFGPKTERRLFGTECAQGEVCMTELIHEVGPEKKYDVGVQHRCGICYASIEKHNWCRAVYKLRGTDNITIAQCCCDTPHCNSRNAFGTKALQIHEKFLHSSHSCPHVVFDYQHTIDPHTHPDLDNIVRNCDYAMGDRCVMTMKVRREDADGLLYHVYTMMQCHPYTEGRFDPLRTTITVRPQENIKHTEMIQIVSDTHEETLENLLMALPFLVDLPGASLVDQAKLNFLKSSGFQQYHDTHPIFSSLMNTFTICVLGTILVFKYVKIEPDQEAIAKIRREKAKLWAMRERHRMAAKEKHPRLLPPTPPAHAKEERQIPNSKPAPALNAPRVVGV